MSLRLHWEMRIIMNVTAVFQDNGKIYFCFYERQFIVSDIHMSNCTGS